MTRIRLEISAFYDYAHSGLDGLQDAAAFSIAELKIIIARLQSHKSVKEESSSTPRFIADTFGIKQVNKI